MGEYAAATWAFVTLRRRGDPPTAQPPEQPEFGHATEVHLEQLTRIAARSGRSPVARMPIGDGGSARATLPVTMSRGAAARSA